MITISSYYSALGKLGKGIPKNYTPEERQKRRERIALVRQRKAEIKAMRDSAGIKRELIDGGMIK